MKIIFAGTPEFAAQHLKAIIDQNQHDILAVYTQPDRPAGRGKKLKPSPVKILAESEKLPIIQVASLKGAEEQAALKSLDADLMIVVAYGLILPKAVLDAPKYGCINVHASLLPRWRGAAPIQRAIEAGDEETGITIMQMDVGLDTGDMLLKQPCAIQASDTSATLHDRLAQLGPPALLKVLEKIDADDLAPEKQDHEQSTYAEKITKGEAEIDWHLPAELIDRRIRAYNPFPIAFTYIERQRLKIQSTTIVDKPKPQGAAPGTLLQKSDGKLVVACGVRALELNQLQLPGKKALNASEFLNGFADILNRAETLGEAPTSD